MQLISIVALDLKAMLPIVMQSLSGFVFILASLLLSTYSMHQVARVSRGATASLMGRSCCCNASNNWTDAMEAVVC